MTDGRREAEEQERSKGGYRMRFGTDLRYHFEDPALRAKGGDKAEFEWIETTFIEGFIGSTPV